MRAVVLAGGLGTRIGRPEKCLLSVGGVPLLFRVVGALMHAGFDQVAVATTPRHVGVVWLARLWGLEVLYTSGRGYHHDLVEVAELAPVLAASCDLADLSPRHVEQLLGMDVFTSATSGGRFVGLSWIPSRDLDRWAEVEVGPLINVNTWEDLRKAEEEAPPAYPIPVDPATLLPHEMTLGVMEGLSEAPIAVDVWTCTVLDGHHRVEAAAKTGRWVYALLLDYGEVEVNMPKLEVLSRAASRLPYPPKTTWHTYRGRHVSQLPYAVGRARRPLRCRPL
ncbi:MAG: NTP transferase domain-containing protein [Pyrobaculum sp.]